MNKKNSLRIECKQLKETENMKTKIKNIQILRKIIDERTNK